jgi:hypothetical protein
MDRFWLAHYAPELMATERRRMPPVNEILTALGGETEVQVVPIPIDCVDGFTEAFYARPEKMLDPQIRKSQSAWGFVPDEAKERSVKMLADDLRSGEWEKRFGSFRTQPFFEGSLRLIIGRPSAK